MTTPTFQTVDDLLAARIAARVTVDSNGCWISGFGKDTSGYSRISVAGRLIGTHRAAYILANGEIPHGLVIDHLCRNRACCNPDHLEAVTIRENAMRGDTIPALHAAKTHCPRGHEYTAENCYPSDLASGRRRRCRACHGPKANAKKRARYAAKKGVN